MSKVFFTLKTIPFNKLVCQRFKLTGDMHKNRKWN